MSRMLNALRQIESRKAVELAEEAKVSHAASASAVATPPAAASDDTHRDEAAMEVLLNATEAAAEQAAADMIDESAESEPPAMPPEDASAIMTSGERPSPRAGSEPRSDPLGELADAMLRSVPHGNPSSFLLTSPDSDTLGIDLLVPLSTSLARRLGADLLLIDANLHRPGLAGRLGVDASRGLTDILSGTASWRDVVRRTVLPGVDVIPAVPFSTPAGPRPDRLHLGRLLAEAKNEYRLVLVHAASLRYPEVIPMARDCEGTYVLTRLLATSRRTLRKAGPILRRAGVNVLGCVVVR